MANEFNLSKTWASGDALTATDLNSQFDQTEDQLDVVQLKQSQKSYQTIFESRDGWEVSQTGATGDAGFYTFGGIASHGAADTGYTIVQPSSLSPLYSNPKINFAKDGGFWFNGRVSHMNSSTYSIVKFGNFTSPPFANSTTGDGVGIMFSNNTSGGDGNLYFFVVGNSTNTKVQIPGITVTNLNDYTIINKAGVGGSVTLYLNNSSAASIATNLPSGTGNIPFAFACQIVSVSAQNLSIGLSGIRVEQII